VGWGLARLAALSGIRLRAAGPPIAHAWTARLLRAQRTRPPIARAAATGLLTTLLPCGWLYAFVATAAAAGSAAGGALVMLAFWAGTLPVLVALGVGVQRLAGPLARRLPAVSAMLVVALGLLSISGRLGGDVGLSRLLPAAGDATAAAVPPSPHAAHAGH